MLKKGSTGGIFIHPWDLVEEGIEACCDGLGHTCGLNELLVAAVYHANTFLLPHNPRRLLRWDDGSVWFTPQHEAWRQTRIRPVLGDGVDDGYLPRLVDAARRRDWGLAFFVVFHFSHSTAQRYPDACQVDALGERQRAHLCPANPEVRAYDLALVADLMGTSGGDGIRHESLGYGRWNSGFVCDKVEVVPAPRDQSLLSLCFCGHCLARARAEGLDPLPLRRAVRDHLYASLPRHPADWDAGPADEEWARNAFDGQLWRYLEVRCNTVTSLYLAVQEVCAAHGGGLMPFGPRQDRSVMGGLDYAGLYPRLQRCHYGAPGATLEQRRVALAQALEQNPPWAEPAMEHNQNGFDSMEALRDHVLMARQAGVRHHTFHYYGMTRAYRLEWIGQARQAWA